MSETINTGDTFTSMAAITELCVNDFDLSVAHYFQKFLSWGLWWYSELQLDSPQQIHTIKLPVSDVLTCQLPIGYVDWCKVAIPWGQYIKTLCINDQLSAEERTLDNPIFSQYAPPGTLPNGVDVTSYGGYMFSNYGGRSLFSVGGALPQTGQFKIVKGDNCYTLLLDAGLGCTEIYLEYIGIGINCCGATIVHPYEKNYVRDSEHHEWYKSLRGPERSQSDIIRTGRDQWASQMKAIGRKNPATPADIIRSSRKNYRLTNKA